MVWLEARNLVLVVIPLFVASVGASLCSTGAICHVYGSGLAGKTDGRSSEAQFNAPQGIAQFRSTLYVADTENHLLRKVSFICASLEHLTLPLPSLDADRHFCWHYQHDRWNRSPRKRLGRRQARLYPGNELSMGHRHGNSSR